MATKLFPSEIIENSAEANFRKHTVGTKLIYTTTVLFVLAVLGALPFISVDVSVRSRGVVTSVTERNQLTSLVSGEIESLYIRENESVTKGDTLSVIAAPLLQEKLQFNTKRQKKVRRYLQDLATLQQVDSTSVLQSVSLLTPKYRQALTEFRQQIRGNIQEVTKAKRAYRRDKQLYTSGMMSEAAYEETSFALQAAENKLKLLFDQQRNTWQSEQVSYQDELDQLMTEYHQLREERQQHIIKAPVSGTIQNIQGIYEGSFVSPNQTLAEISPDTGLIAECYVPPKDIGLIKEGMEARFQISAFDYNQWGMLTGKVTEISNDITIINDQPVFTVRSSLDRTYLELPNNYRGNLKKGMTMQARFTITRRSLFQLLYDNVDDWLNPNWDEPDSQSKQTAAM